MVEDVLLKRLSDAHQQVDSLLGEVLSLKSAQDAVHAQFLDESQILALTHVLCLSGSAAQCLASRAILESDERKKAKLFLLACATRHSEFNDTLKRRIIRLSGLNNYLAELVTPSVPGSPSVVKSPGKTD